MYIKNKKRGGGGGGGYCERCPAIDIQLIGLTDKPSILFGFRFFSKLF